MNKEKVIIICGPTASGKTGLSIELAKQINGEIISADSMQIYKKMDIGTAKATTEEMQGIKHYLLDIIEPDKRYSVAKFAEDALIAITEILKKGKVPIIVGGTGLYIETLVYGIEYPDVKIDEEYRQYLEEIVQNEGIEKLYLMACDIDKEAMQSISKTDKKRICRVLEIYKATNKTKTMLEKESRKNGPKFDYLLYGINMDREKLYERINIRIDKMLDDGLIQEVQKIKKEYKNYPTSMQALGYKEVVQYLENKMTKEEMVEKLKMETRRYAKRQITWFKRYENIIWINSLENKEKNIQTICKEYCERKK